MSIEIQGTIGAKNVAAHLKGAQLTLKTNQQIVFEGLVLVICFQRVSKRLKTCDVVYIDGRNCHVQTIEQSQMEVIHDNATCPVYDVGLDPLPWKKFAKDAKKHKWQLEDWQHLFEAETESEEDEDAEWRPDDEEDDDEEDDDVDEAN